LLTGTISDQLHYHQAHTYASNATKSRYSLKHSISHNSFFIDHVSLPSATNLYLQTVVNVFFIGQAAEATGSGK
jgi:hypothetical protein